MVAIHTSYIMSCLLFRLSSRSVASSGLLVNAAAQRDSRQTATPFSLRPSPSEFTTTFRRGALLSSADHRTASGSDAGSAAPSGPVSARKDTPATQLSPDIQALIKLSVDQAAKEAFKAGMQYSQVLTYFEGCVSSLFASKLRI